MSSKNNVEFRPALPIAKFPDYDLVISPKELVNFAIFGMNNIGPFLNLGYTATIKSLK